MEAVGEFQALDRATLVVLLKVEQGSCSRAGSKQRCFNNISELKQWARAEHTSRKSARKGAIYL